MSPNSQKAELSRWNLETCLHDRLSPESAFDIYDRSIAEDRFLRGSDPKESSSSKKRKSQIEERTGIGTGDNSPITERLKSECPKTGFSFQGGSLTHTRAPRDDNARSRGLAEWPLFDPKGTPRYTCSSIDPRSDPMCRL